MLLLTHMACEPSMQGRGGGGGGGGGGVYSTSILVRPLFDRGVLAARKLAKG